MRAQDVEEPVPPVEAPPEEAAERAPMAASSAQIAVLMLPTGDVDPAMADALTELMIATVAGRERGIRIVGKEEFQSQLGRGDADTVDCIETAACLGRVGVQLGVTEVIAGTIARRVGPEGELVWAFNLNRLEVRTGELLGRVFREVTGDLDELLRALEESFPELYAVRVTPGRLVVRASQTGAEVELDGAVIGRYEGTPLRRETVEPGTHVLRVRAPGHREFVREVDVEEGATFVIEAALEPIGAWTPSPLVYVGAGVTVGALAGAIGLALSSQGQPGEGLTMRDTIDGFYPARETEALMANVLFGIAGAGAILGVIGIVLSGEQEQDEAEPAVRAWIAPAPGGAMVGAMVGAEGRF